MPPPALLPPNGSPVNLKKLEMIFAPDKTRDYSTLDRLYSAPGGDPVGKQFGIFMRLKTFFRETLKV